MTFWEGHDTHQRMKRASWLWLLFTLVLLSLFQVWRGLSMHPPGKHRSSSSSEKSGSPVAQQPVMLPVEAGPANAASTTGAAPVGDRGARVVLRQKAMLDAERQAFLASLKPRRVPVKEALHVPEGRQLRLTVKLRDELHGRVDAEGRVSVVADDFAAVSGLGRLAVERDLRFRRVQTASDEELSDLSERAARRTGVAQPDLAGHVEIIASAGTRDALITLAQAFHALPEIEYAELESLDRPPPPPAVDISPVTPLLVGNQTYRGASTGVNVDHVWNTFGIRGDAGLKVTDCEYEYNPAHEDLNTLVQMQPNVVSMYTAFGHDHGTAVLGIIASGWNAYGTTGSVPECVTRFYPEFSTLTTGSQSRTACVTAAIAASAAGDIVMLEMQADGPASGSADYVPAEYTLSVWNAVKTGTDAGVIVTAAAGNGNQNLSDAVVFSAYNGRGDSGAIIVGAGSSARVKSSFSTYGARVNVQGWGGGVFTTGYGTHATYGSDVNQRYASGFNGTSSATPVVTSAVALLQSVAIKILGRRLSPAEMRTILVTTGRAQTGSDAATAPIGPLPELQAAVNHLLSSQPPSFSTLESWGYYHFASPTPDLAADSDGDGIGELLEYVFGTDPKNTRTADMARLPRIVSVSPSFVTFHFDQPASRTGATWVVQQSESLAAGSWQNLTHGVNGVTITRAGDVIQVSMPASVGSQFLRVQATAN